ncbi:MAG: phosphatidylserine decarboxylase family protein [Deltaproteobacteria bacterium]|nr:phosphatidylserine decarboxylase family protein [Deltaproteobacteria bacterium]
MRLAREGYTYVALAVALAVLGLASAPRCIAWPLVALAGLVVNFFRDPDRLTPAGEGLIAAPADGKVVAITDVMHEEQFVRGACRRISIFMSPLNVHVNRIPVDGVVRHVQHFPGRFVAAFLDKASELNERNAVVVEDRRGARILFVQIAGQLARRIVCKVAAGDEVRRGDRYGMIMFGSRLDLYVPEVVKLHVAIGDRTTAGVTIVGSYS